MDVPFFVWALTIAAIVGLLVFDFVGHVRTPHAPTLRESAIWSAAYVGMAVVFGLLVLVFSGGAAAIEQFSWVFYLFGAILLYTAWVQARSGGHDDGEDYQENAVLRFA